MSNSNSLYICSTVRHLLFAVSKASNHANTRSTILFFKDYQNVDRSSIDSSKLPSNIELIILNRADVTHHLKHRIIGRLLLVIAMREFSVNIFFRKKLLQYISEVTPKMNIECDKLQLFVFNEKNKMSRLFRLLVNEYSMIEDGVGNYYEIPVRGFKKIGRLLSRKPVNYWVFGEERRCKNIYAVSPEKLPTDVKMKGIEIDFLGLKKSIQLVNQVFKFTPNSNTSLEFIIATQPTPQALKHRLLDPEYLIKLNQFILDCCYKNNLNVVIKLHPSESLDLYLKHYPNEQFLSVKHPLELQILNSSSKPIILSINSTAGLGFEAFCTRRKLLPDEELSRFIEVVVAWERNPEMLTNRINDLMKIGNS